MPIKSNSKLDIRIKLLQTFEDKKIFLEALLNPPNPNNALKKAQSNYKKFIELHNKKPF